MKSVEPSFFGVVLQINCDFFMLSCSQLILGKFYILGTNHLKKNINVHFAMQFFIHPRQCYNCLQVMQLFTFL